MKILVTGGSGFLGTHMCKLLGADDFSRRSGLDVLNMQDAQRVKDYDVVIHLAAILDKSPDATEMVFLTNVDGTINLLRSMNEDAVFIFASTKDVYGRFADNYKEVPETCPTIFSGQSALEWSKLIAERYVEFTPTKTNFVPAFFVCQLFMLPFRKATRRISSRITPRLLTRANCLGFPRAELHAAIYSRSKILHKHAKLLLVRSFGTGFTTWAADVKTL